MLCIVETCVDLPNDVFCDVSATFCGHSPPPCSPTVGSWCGSLLTDEPCEKRCVFDETCVDNRSGFFLDVFEGSCAKIKSGFRCRFDIDDARGRCRKAVYYSIRMSENGKC